MFMKRNKYILIIITLIVLLAVSTVFCACDKQRGDEQAQRKSAVARIENAFINGIDAEWSASLSDGEVAMLDNGGDFVVNLEWTHLAGEVLLSSSLRTEKLSAIADAFETQEAKAILYNFDENADVFIKLLKSIGLTPSDAANLVNGLAVSLIDNADAVVDKSLARLESIKPLCSALSPTVDNVNKNIALLNSAKTGLLPNGQQKQELRSAFDDAKGAVSSIVSFAYDVSIDTITQEVFDILLSEDGALGNVSNSELITIVNAFLRNVSQLKKELDGDSILKLNRAFSMFLEQFDKDVLGSVLYSQIIKYAKYAYTVVDIIPTVCDVAVAGGDILGNVEFLSDLKTVYDKRNVLDKNTNTVNSLIITARLVKNVVDNMDAQSFKQAIDKIQVASMQDYQKAIPIFGIDLMLNSVMFVDGANNGELNIVHGDILDEGTVGMMLSTAVFFDNAFYAFKEAYKQYNRDEISIYTLRDKAISCGFESYGCTNPYNLMTQTDEWYDYYVRFGIKAVNDWVKTSVPKAVADIKAFIDDYYAEGSATFSALQTLASSTVCGENASQDVYDGYASLAKQSGLSWVLLLG